MIGVFDFYIAFVIIILWNELDFTGGFEKSALFFGGNMELRDSISSIKNVGTQRQRLLNSMGIFTVENLLEHFDFEIKGRERIAITGPNGSGKTTFLRLIAGELFLERDDRRQGEGIYLARNVTIGMLRQQIFENTAHTVQEEMMVLCPSRDTWDRERFEFE